MSSANQLDPNFKKYGPSFQTSALSLIVQDRSFGNKVKEILLPNYFDNKYYQWICEEVLKYYAIYKTNPKWEDVEAIIENNIGDKTKSLYLNTLKTIKDADLGNRPFIEAEVNKFCFTRFALNKLEEERAHILLGNFDMAKGIAYNTYKPINEEGREIDLKEDLEKILEAETHTNIVPTMLETFNAITKGGPGAGDLVIVTAASNLGKTAFLVALARHAASLGKNVAYFSLETKGEQIAERAIAGLVGIPQEFLREHPDLIRRKVNELPANIKFIQFKATQAKTDLITDKIAELKSTGFFPDMVIVDGLNQLKASKNMKFANTNDKFEYLAEELRDMAFEEHIPCYAAFQGNRGSFSNEAADEQNIGKAIEVYQVCDLMIMLTQTPTMLDAKECYATMLKNRLGPKGVMLLLDYDTSIMKFVEKETVQRSMVLDKKARTQISHGIDSIQQKLNSRTSPITFS